jgi:HSP20 family protein
MTNALDFFNSKNLFDFTKSFNEWFGNFGFPTTFANSPKVNVKETDKAYEIEIANPGFTKDETKIEVTDGVIHVSMNLEAETKDDNKYHVHQWEKSSYNESWNIPEDVIEEQISAKHTDGVLTITLPKKEKETKQVESRTITIE